ncbi:ESX secretion-associated protein EspG [Amycolatopsis sp. 195334CR]|uniref:ESX secretion-associated protein EspG n=1 Tax=Amycolatopsis sp. 195334CR TaxID=2814588 RepID=UPI001A8CFAB7|nr:ESX secretion-associated protein EspG [Amycolatopsis sp. 195334CR]MBN6040060.1 ESX secretion-associated protein EspG [Amycolatopsis sp. 195334CR]
MTFEFTIVDGLEARILALVQNVEIRHYPLSFPGVDLNPARLAHTARVAEQQLATRRLSVRGRINTHVCAAFDLFKQHRVAVGIAGKYGEDGFASLGLTDGSQALIVRQDSGDQRTHFTLLPDEEWVHRLSHELPAALPGAGPPATVEHASAPQQSAYAARRAERARHDDDETSAFDNLPVQTMVRPPDNPFHGPVRSEHDRFRDLQQLPRTGVGHFRVVANSATRPKRDADMLCWFDSDQGRYLTSIHHHDDGRVTTCCRPGGDRELRESITRAVRQVY